MKELQYDFISEKILTNKSLKKITIEIDENDYWETDSRNFSEYFIIIMDKRNNRKKILMFKLILKISNHKNDLNLDYYKFIELFKLYINIQNKENYKNLLKLKI